MARATNTNVVIGTTSTSILTEAFRHAVYICNMSNEDIYLSFDSPAVLNSGMIVRANGGTLVFNKEDDEILIGLPINGICLSGNKTISVTYA